MIWRFLPFIALAGGYYEALAKPERKLDDNAHALNLRMVFHTGPVYHFGDVVFKGLNAALESKARLLWNPPGNVWDLMYSSHFLGEFKKDPAIRALEGEGAGTRVAADATG